LQRLADAGAGQGGADRGQHRSQLLDVVGLLGQLGCDHDLLHGGRGWPGRLSEEQTQLQVVDHVEDEPGQMVGWQPVAQVGWQKGRLVAVAARKLSAMADPT
jgi:hypothetical protein